MKDKVTIYWTTDYSKFKLVKGNQPMREDKVKKLIKALKKDSFIEDFPILVNEKFEIIDGQHRFWALKQLGYPVAYRISKRKYTLKNIIDINQEQDKWPMRAFLSSNCDLGNKNYVRLINDMEEYGITPSVVSQIIYNHTDHKKIRNGSLKYSEVDSLELKIFMDELEIFNQYSFYKDWRFIRGLVYVRGKDEYDHEKMSNQINKYGEMLVKRPNWGSYSVYLIKVFNHRQPSDARIKLDMEEIDRLTKS